MKRKLNYFYVFIILLISLAAGILLYGGFGSSNNNEQIPLLYRMIDNSYLSNDWFVNINTNSDFVDIRFPFHLFILSLNYIVHNLEILYFLLFLISYFFIGLATYFISKTLFRDDKAAFLTSFSVIFGSSFALGGVFLVADILIPSLISTAFILWGFYFFLKDRDILFSLMFGFAILFHFLLGGLVFTVILLSGIFNNYSLKNNFKKYFRPVLIIFFFILLISPILISQVNTNVPLSGKEISYILGDFRHPHHYMPFSWDIMIYLKFFFLFFLFILAFKNSQIEKNIKSLVKNIVYIIFILFLIGTVFVEIIPISFIVKLQLFRISSLLLFIEYLFIVPYIYKKLEISFKERSNLRMLYCFLLIFSLFFPPLILISLPLFVIGEFLYYKKRPIFEKFNDRKFILFGILFTLIISLFFLELIINLINQWPDAIINKIFILALLLSFVALISSGKQKLKFLVIILIIILSLIILTIRYPVLYYTYDKNTQETYDFIKSSIPKEAILLSPPYMETFRLGAERAIVVDFKSFPFSEKSMLEWYGRIGDVTNNLEFNPREKEKKIYNLKRGYDSLSEEDILILRSKYNFSYAIFEKPKDLNFTIAFENKNYLVYQIR